MRRRTKLMSLWLGGDGADLTRAGNAFQCTFVRSSYRTLPIQFIQIAALKRCWVLMHV